MNWFIFILVMVCYGLYGREVGLFFKKQLGCAGKEAEIFAVFCFLGCMVEYSVVLGKMVCSFYYQGAGGAFAFRRSGCTDV